MEYVRKKGKGKKSHRLLLDKGSRDGLEGVIGGENQREQRMCQYPKIRLLVRYNLKEKKNEKRCQKGKEKDSTQTHTDSKRGTHEHRET